MLQTLVAQLGVGAILVVCLYALIVGSWRERFGAIIYLAAYLVSFGFGLIAVEHATLYLLVADLLCLQGFYVLSWKSPHAWPRWAVAGQLVSVVAEIANLFHVGLSDRNFMTIEMTAGWGVLLALLIGAIAAAQARRDAKRTPVAK